MKDELWEKYFNPHKDIATKVVSKVEFLAALESQPVPVEPAIVGWLEHHKAGDNIGWEQVDHHYAKADALIKKSDYDALRAYAVQADIAAKIHAKDVFNLTEKVIPNIRERAEKAEALAEQCKTIAFEWGQGVTDAETAIRKLHKLFPIDGAPASGVRAGMLRAAEICDVERRGYELHPKADTSHTGPNAYIVGYQEGCSDCETAITRAADQVNTEPAVQVPSDVVAYSCVNEVAGLVPCKQWCGDMKKCVAKLEDK